MGKSEKDTHAKFVAKLSEAGTECHVSKLNILDKSEVHNKNARIHNGKMGNSLMLPDMNSVALFVKQLF